MDSLQDEVKAALRSTDRLKLRASSDRCGISTTTKTSTAQLRRNLQQWLEDVDGSCCRRCSAVILRRAFTTVLCSSVALVCARRDYAVISVGTLSTSIIYWRKPRRGSVERQFDRLWVLLSFLYQGRSACRELGAGRLAAYWALALITLCCYARARASALPDRSTPRRAGTRASTSWATWRTPSSTPTRASTPLTPGVAFRFSWPTGSSSRRRTSCGARGRARLRNGQSAPRGGRRASPPPRPGWRTPSLRTARAPPRGPTRLVVRPRELHRCDNYVVIDKPPSLSMDGVQALYPEAKFCHQLDAATSGCLALALSRPAARRAHDAFRARNVRKTYVALVDGVIDLDAFRPAMPPRASRAACASISASLCLLRARAETDPIARRNGLRRGVPARDALECGQAQRDAAGAF